MNVELPHEETLSKNDTIASEQASGFVEIDNESYYRIADSGDMPPFLMNIVSGTNHWMFVASNGALTAGRTDADNALFPYYTQDKLFDLAHTVGSSTLFWVSRGKNEAVLWEPFKLGLLSDSIERNLYKSGDGNKVIFEERNDELGLVYRYKWETSDRYGFVRTSKIENVETSEVKIHLLDGIQNLVPFGLDQTFMNLYSNLADAYKKNELLACEGLGIYYLSSIPSDRAEPSEGLRATVAWSSGLERKSVLVSTAQVDAFRAGSSISSEGETRGLRCAYYVESKLELIGQESKQWVIVADINQNATQVERLRVELSNPEALLGELREDVSINDRLLHEKIGVSDGLQLTSDKLRDARHRSNTLFNIMRGGIFDDGYDIDLADFKKYLKSWNSNVLKKYEQSLKALGEEVPHSELMGWAENSKDNDLIRLTTEYLPLSFSRRHGDPSRPWNKFSIETQDSEGNPILAYQGNWRDIFQNWEPLAYSFPGFLTGMISRFLNSSTADGYNPYRVTRDGFDWEVLDEDEAWSNIGYWGDHQIVYLLKLVEALEKHDPEALNRLLSEDQFVYAHVPYRIRGFEKIWENPRDTVDYDYEAAEAIANRPTKVGADDKLLRSTSGGVVRANLMEKLLAPLLAKMSNFVLGGGIWMNTQRPEWNDANNALVGYGVSVVTLCYINRYLEFLQSLLTQQGSLESIEIDSKILDFLNSQLDIMVATDGVLDGELDASIRFEMLEALGNSGEAFRNSVYETGFGEAKSSVSIDHLQQYIRKALAFVGHSIDSNRREDGMYHSYNLLNPVGDRGVEIDRLSEMLEGQVAVLSSNRLSVEESLELVQSLRKSALYREDVDSYILYPDRDLPSFLDKNNICSDRVISSTLLSSMISKGDDRIVSKDVSGQYRFNGDFRSAEDVSAILEIAKADYASIVNDSEIKSVLSVFEDTFNHRSFTGRSGTFFAYEGLGSVYWHMVSKLLLAIQDNYFKGCRAGVSQSVLDGLSAKYFETLNGLGFDKTPAEYGAFPVDAYSHTPKHAGAQQPGMTGQVKEDILSRWGELGVFVNDACLAFVPKLLRESEFLKAPEDFSYIAIDGKVCSEKIESNSLAFTYCQTLVVYVLGNAPELTVVNSDSSVEKRSSLSLSVVESRSLFDRDGSISRINVTIPRSYLIK